MSSLTRILTTSRLRPTLLGVITLGFLTSNAICAVPVTEKDAIEIVRAFCERANVTFPEAKDVPLTKRLGPATRKVMSGRNCIRFMSGDLSAAIDCDSAELTFFMNGYRMREIGRTGPPKKPPCEVLKRARQLRDCAYRAHKGTLKLSHITFTTAQGYWRAGWRILVDGYEPLYANNISVEFCESGELLSYMCRRWCDTVSTKVGVGDEAAIEASAPAAEKIAKRFKLRKRGFTAAGAEPRGLFVLVPNWILDPDRPDWEVMDPKGADAKLAWVVDWHYAHSDQFQGKVEYPMPPDVTVYVEASSGKVIGGSCTP